MINFWNTLKENFVGLAPMDGVTDHIYRYIIAKYGKPDFIMTEFTAAEGLAHNAIKLLEQLKYDETERPIVAQIFGLDPESFYVAAIIVSELGFDGIDINMGCPAKKVSGRGAGAGLIQNPELAGKLIEAVQAGVKDYADGKVSLKDLKIKKKMKDAILEAIEKHPKIEKREIPVSVKTRIGYEKENIEKWIKHILSYSPAVITVHGRTFKQMYSGEADWDIIAKAVVLAKDSNTIIIGNGDVQNRADAEEKCVKYGTDGVMIGRATFGNPWVFKNKESSFKERVALAIDHCSKFEKEVGENYFFVMRKYLGWYIKGHPRAKELRMKLMQANNTSEVKDILKDI